jgi:hypothetical protein
LVAGSGPAAGALAFNANGAFTYTMPANGSTGAQSFQYTATNGIETSVPATVSINVTPPPNQAPIGVADFLFVSENSSGAGIKSAVLSPSVLGNDSDPDNNLPLQVAGGSVSPLSPAVPSGSVAASATGNVTFGFAHNWLGDTTFTYRAQDSGSPALSSADTTVHVIRDFRITTVSNIGSLNVLGVQRSLPYSVTYEMLSGTGCPVPVGTVLDTSVVAANATAVGNLNLLPNAGTLRWTGSNTAGRALCQNIVVRATYSANGGTPAHTTSVTVPLTVGTYINP